MHIRTLAAACLTSVALAVPAEAQYGFMPASNRATGENYHVEVSGDLWNPTPTALITSEWNGIVGSEIDFVDDLGIEKTRFTQLKVVLRPATKHKFRFEYTPIRYEATSTLTRQVTFNGINYPVTQPVDSSLRWRAFRFGYEWDFIYRDRGFVGLLLEAKYTDVEAALANVENAEVVRARAPIPAIGIIGRGYVLPSVSITGEFSAFKLPGSIDEDYSGKYFDFDIYGTANFTDHFGAQFGYRSFDVFYEIEDDTGELTLKGFYFGGVVRF